MSYDIVEPFYRKEMEEAGPVGFEPTTYSLGGCRAIHSTQTPTVNATAERLLRYEPRPNIKLLESTL